jgi:biofilm PGA synthesis N-glycosyltransferase PgaC
VWVSGPWRDELGDAIGPVIAWVIPLFLAYIPGLVIGFMIFTLLACPYREARSVGRAPEWPRGEWPAVTIVVAAWNEEGSIVATFEQLGELHYSGAVQVVLADNNSTDRTAELARDAAERLELDYRRVFEPEAGKHRALNAALETVTTPILVTVDADTFLQRESLAYLVGRLLTMPQDQHMCACAGGLVVQNPHADFLTRMQQWDYRLGINGVKRMQAAYNSALVAQGAFSAYWVDDLRAVGGWPDAIGEDIVLTWTMMASRGLVQYEPVALGFTVVPERLRRLMSQRSRWARGMFEGLRSHPPPSQPRVLASSSRESTTSCRSWTSASSSSGFPA